MANSSELCDDEKLIKTKEIEAIAVIPLLRRKSLFHHQRTALTLSLSPSVSPVHQSLQSQLLASYVLLKQSSVCEESGWQWLECETQHFRWCLTHTTASGNINGSNHLNNAEVPKQSFDSSLWTLACWHRREACAPKTPSQSSFPRCQL